VALVDLPYLSVFTVRRGRRAWPVAYYRRDGVRTRLLGADGAPVDPADGPAVLAAWTAVHEAWGRADAAAANAAEARAVRAGSLADLIARYRRSAGFLHLRDSTRVDYEKQLRPLEAAYGHLLVIGMRRAHVLAIRDRYAWRDAPDPDRPGEVLKVTNARQANRMVTTLSILLTHAVDLGWRPDNPALRPKRLPWELDDYEPWTEAQWLQFQERADPEWQFYALLATLTDQRGQDLVRMKWTDYDGSHISVAQEKGRKTVKLRIEAHPALRAALDLRREAMAQRSPVPLTIMATAAGRPWSVGWFQKVAGRKIREAGLTGVVWHGLRATGASWATEGGASSRAVQMLLGHKTSRMSEHYSRGADQQRLAAAAVGAIAVPIRQGRG
jgi:integrase